MVARRTDRFNLRRMRCDAGAWASLAPYRAVHCFSSGLKASHDLALAIVVEATPRRDFIEGTPATGAKARAFVNDADVNTGRKYVVAHIRTGCVFGRANRIPANCGGMKVDSRQF